jgi:exosome complex RNA-binding protein Rrp42 (RNase PH superfamily)
MANATFHDQTNIGTQAIVSQIPSSSSSSFLSSWLSQSECEYIRQGCGSNCRLDGRERDQFRQYTIIRGSTSATSSSKMTLNKHPSLFVSSLSSCYGSSRLYDTVTCGSLIDMVCSIKAELVQPSCTAPVEGDIEITLCTDQTSSSSSNQISTMLREYETALQQYYVPCLLNSLHQSPMKYEPNEQPCQQSTNGSLCVIPGAVVWKLFIDVYIISLLSNNDRSIGSSVYYLDAVAHCINAALYETILPSIAIDSTTNNSDGTETSTSKTSANSSSSIIDRMVLDSSIANAKPLLRKETIPKLPIIVTTHVVQATTNVIATGMLQEDSKNDVTTSLILDATAEEEAVSVAAVHAVIVPTMTTTPPPRDENRTSGIVGAVWKTLRGSIPMSILPKCVEAAMDAAPVAYQHFQVQ